MWQTLPDFGTLVLYAVLVAAAYSFALAVAASGGRPRLLTSARLGAYATCALVGLDIALLAYGFVTHDFRLRYVSRYSDRSMSTPYLMASLWGGQDGSLLWWSTLLAGYTTAVLTWMRGRFRALQPVVIATLMAVLAFFVVLMLFAANPFQVNLAGTPGDGEGLNPLLQNYWMVIHPPMLYSGFVGCTIPFAFAVAALVTRRLDNEWITAVRKWMLFAWLGLSIGNILGMVWAYEELGWGGFWAWDPVENAAALPWFTATAYLHSTMIQERRGMLKVWNVVLICTTFFLTIFGTFLTRSGLISSVHAFAQSDIGIFFVWFMGLLVAVSAALIVWRLPYLRAQAQVEALLSREATFVINNWALVGLMVFVGVTTLFPKLSEWLYHETITVGPPFYNRWAAPMGLLVFLLMGLAPLFGWRKTSPSALRRAFVAPTAVAVVVAVLHLAFGARLGFPAHVARDAQSSGLVDVALQKIASLAPFFTVVLAAFNVAVIVQEFVFGVRARRSAAQGRGTNENIGVALVRLVNKNRRRYGGYIVHLGITCMFLGFVGTAWSTTREVGLGPGETTTVAGYSLKYLGPRMCPGNPKCSREEQADTTKRMVFADVDVSKGGKYLGRLSPAKFIYQRGSGMTTTEVGLMRGLRADLYLVAGMVNPQTKRVQLQVHVNTLVSWIWIGILVLILGAALSLWPEVAFSRLGAWGAVRTLAGATTAVLLAVGLASSLGSSRPPGHRVAAAAAAPMLPMASVWSEVPLRRRVGVTGAASVGVVMGVLGSRMRRSSKGRR